MTEIHEGGCFCDANRYRVRGAPSRVSACSCAWCRKRTGSALGISVYFAEENVEFTKKSLARYRLTSDAGRWIEQEFCTACGTALTWTLEFLPGRRLVRRSGVLVQDPALCVCPVEAGLA